jgi:hypothetical protein
MVAKTYEQALAALVDRLNDSTDIEGLKDHVKEILADGQLGVRHLTNAELQEEWGSQFSEALTLTEPHNNPNAEPATPIVYAAMRRRLKKALESLEQVARRRPDDVELAEIVQSIRAVSTTSLSQMSLTARLRATARVRPETVALRSESAQRRLEEIEERLKALGFVMDYDAGAMPGEDPLKWLSTDEPVDPDEEGVPQEALDLALEWSTNIDSDSMPSEPTAGDRPGYATESRRAQPEVASLQPLTKRRSLLQDRPVDEPQKSAQLRAGPIDQSATPQADAPVTDVIDPGWEETPDEAPTP